MNKDEFNERFDLNLPQIITNELIMIKTVEEIREDIVKNKNDEEINKNNIFGVNEGDKMKLNIIITIPETRITVTKKYRGKGKIILKREEIKMEH